MINEFIQVLRSVLMEALQEQVIVVMTVSPGGNPKYESLLRIYGLDKATYSGGGTGGFGGEDDEDLGAWKILNLPTETETGMRNPPAWVLFMDWLWKALKSKDLEPAPYLGFGDISKPYSELPIHGRRVRKYGEMAKGSYQWWDIRPMMKRGSGGNVLSWQQPGKEAKSEKISIGQAGIKKDVTVTITSLGIAQDEIDDGFRKLLKSVNNPGWFKIKEEEGRWFVVVQMEAEEPEGWQERLKTVTAFKRENREKWNEALKAVAGGRIYPQQLHYIVARYLIAYHGFSTPFNVDLLEQSELDKALNIVKSLTLEELTKFASDKNIKLPPIGATKQTGAASIVDYKWDSVISRLAEEGNVEEPVVQVALSDYLAANGFNDPFDFDLLSPTNKIRAIRIADKLRYSDISSFVESVQRLLKSLKE